MREFRPLHCGAVRVPRHLRSHPQPPSHPRDAERRGLRVRADKAEPQLAAWKARLIAEPILQPRSLDGYFLACADGDRSKIHAFEGREEIRRIPFPRQASGRRLCIADFEPESAGRLDVLPCRW
ncbi:MAG: hypothetical protein IPL96_13540 [Holophagaceae bacterium]|nr:hypothetical protein [Holophagaceae bacterium]